MNNGTAKYLPVDMALRFIQDEIPTRDPSAEMGERTDQRRAESGNVLGRILLRGCMLIKYGNSAHGLALPAR